MDVLAIARAGATLHSLAAEDLAAIFTRLELRAAAEAVRKAALAKDSVAAIRSAIVHLESAEVACRQHTNVGEDIKLPFGFRWMTNAAASRAHEVQYHFYSLFYIQMVMATLYYHIHEIDLAADAIMKLVDSLQRWNRFRDTVVVGHPGHYLTPSNWRYLTKPLPVEDSEIQEFLEVIQTWPG